MTEAQPHPERRWPAHLALWSVVALHLALLAYFCPPSTLLSKQPVAEIDYSLHLYQVDRALKAFFGFGKLWGYDPLVLAGQPAGVVEDLTSKGTELFVIGARALGIHAAFAFNLFILLVMLALPASGWAAARLFGLPRRTAVVVVLLWVLLWYFDSFLHWSWWIGMITWAAVCYLTVLHIALLYRIFESGRRMLFLPLAVLSALIALIHPFGVITVLPPALAMYGRDFKKMAGVDHLLLWLSALAGAATTLVWIVPALGFRHYIGDADTFFNATLEYLVYDTLDLLKDPLQTGEPVRTMLRTLCFVAGGVTLWRWRRAEDRRVLPLAVLVVVSLLFAYGAAYFKVGRQTQPYRQIGPAILAAALPAAALLRDLVNGDVLSRMQKSGRLLLLLALLLALPRFVRTVAYYVPQLLPERVLRSERDLFVSPLVGLQEALPLGQRMHAASPERRAVRRWLLEHHAGRGRIVVMEWMLGEYLAATTPLPLLGGMKERNVPHVAANLLRNPAGEDPTKRAFSEYLKRYAAGWLVIGGDYSAIDSRRDVLDPVEVVGGYRIYRTKIEPSYFLRGQGRLAEQSFNLLKVAGARGDEVVLRHHWMESLRCRPACKIERFEIPDDRVGFIRVADPPARFEIYNAYEY